MTASAAWIRSGQDQIEKEMDEDHHDVNEDAAHDSGGIRLASVVKSRTRTSTQNQPAWLKSNGLAMTACDCCGSG